MGFEIGAMAVLRHKIRTDRAVLGFSFNAERCKQMYSTDQVAIECEFNALGLVGRVSFLEGIIRATPAVGGFSAYVSPVFVFSAHPHHLCGRVNLTHPYFTLIINSLLLGS